MFALPRSIPEITTLLGERLRQARIAMNWTQAQAASRAGVSLQTIGRIESGKGGTIESLLKYAQALDKLREMEGLFEIRPTSIAQIKARKAIKHRTRVRHARLHARKPKGVTT